MDYKVIEDFGFATKGDVFKNVEYGYLLNKNAEGQSVDILINKDYAEALATEGKLIEVCNTDALNKVKTFVENKIEQYENDYNEMIKSYDNHEIPTCVKVEAETVYTNMTKLLNEVKRLINE